MKSISGRLLLSLLILSTPCVTAAQSITTVVSAADYGAAIAPGSIASVFGANLANTHAAATLDALGNLPTSLNGTSVSVNGELAGLFYISPGQVNFLVPKDIPIGNVSISIASPTLPGPVTVSAQIQLSAPGVFTIACLRTDRGAVENGVTAELEPFQATTQQNPGNDKRTRLSIYGTGFRYADNSARNDSTPATSHVAAQIIDSNHNTFAAPVEYAGPQRILAGLDQINIVLPPETDGLGVATLQLSVDGVAARPVTIALSPKSVAASQPGALSLSTVAGSGAPGSGGDNSAALLAQLRDPSAVAFDAGHNLYIADSDNHVIRMVNSAGTISTFAGTGVSGFAGDNGPAATAQLRRPVSLAFDSMGNLYVADAADNRVRKISPAGVINTVAGTGEAGFFGDNGPAISAGLNAPGGIAVNAEGTLFIADTANDRVRRVTADGLISTIAGTGTASSDSQASAYLTPLSGPTDVSVDPSGNVLVADSDNFVIRSIGTDGTISTIAGAGISGSAGTNCPALQALFGSPIHLFATPSGQLIVADGQQVRIIDANCNIYDAAGVGAAGFSGDGGNALQGALNTPLGLAVDQTGNIYVADSANQRIRKLSVSPSTASLSFHPAAAKGGQTVSGYIDLGSSSSTPSVVQLSSSPSLADLPGTVTIPAGQTTGVVTFTAPEVNAQTPVTVTASGPGLDVSGMLTEAPASGSAGSGNGTTPALASLTLGSDNIPVGDTTTGTIALTQPAPAGGLPVTLTSNNPAARVVRSFVIPAGQTGAQFLVTSGAASVPATATITAEAGGAGLSAALNIAAAPGGNGTATNPQSGALGSLAQISVNPSVVTAGQTATGTITLASPAGPNGVSATIASSDPSVTVPSTVTVTPGASTAAFPINTAPVNTAVTATIMASSANSLATPITVNPATAAGAPGTGTVAGISIDPPTIVGGQPATGTVTLANPAGPGGVSVGLSSSVPGVTVPAGVTVPQGTTSATFPVTTSSVRTPASGRVTATSANATSTAVTVTPASNSNTPGTGTVAGVSINPSTITGGQPATGTVSLASPAGAGGVSVGLSSNVPGVTVPASLTVPQGSTSATFPVTTSPVSTAASGNITASSANSLSTPVTVTPASNSNTPGTGTVAGVSINPSTITGGQPATGTVSLANPAGTGGVSVGLSSSVPGVTVPASVTVPQGSASATFPVTTSPVSTAASGNITASSANSLSTPVTVTPASNSNTPGTGTVAGVSINPSTITGGQPATGTVTLASPAGPGGVSVGLSSSIPGVTVPASLTVPQGSTSATFPVTTSPVSTAASGNITASSANSLSAPVTVIPAAVNNVTPASVTFSPNSVTGGQSVTGTVSLSGAAPAGGTTVQLTSNSASVAVPGSVSVAAGQTSTTFTVSTTPVASTTSATITASAGGASTSGAVTVSPPCPSFVSASLGTPTLSGGVPVTVNTTLNGAAPSGGVNVGLASQGSSVGNITVPAGQTSGSSNLTLANALGLIGGGIDALSGSCPLIHGTVN